MPASVSNYSYMNNLFYTIYSLWASVGKYFSKFEIYLVFSNFRNSIHSQQ